MIGIEAQSYAGKSRISKGMGGLYGGLVSAFRVPPFWTLAAGTSGLGRTLRPGTLDYWPNEERADYLPSRRTARPREPAAFGLLLSTAQG